MRSGSSSNRHGNASWLMLTEVSLITRAAERGRVSAFGATATVMALLP
jgi:hypothetical protein